MNIDLALVIATSLVLFLIGIFGLSTKRDGLKMIYALEILVCASNLVFVSVGYLSDINYPIGKSQTYTILSLGVGGAIIGLAISLLSAMYKKNGSIDLEQNIALRW